MLERVLDPLALARRCRHRAYLASSYDRRGGNHDWSNYPRVEGSEAVLLDAEGPGSITRIWTADPQSGLLRIYLDDRREPVLALPFRELFSRLPLSFGIGGESPQNYARSAAEHLPMGHTSYCPIPFAKHCKVTIEPEDDYLYYQVNYRRWSVEQRVETFDPARLDAGVRPVEALVRRWSGGGLLVEEPTHRVDLDVGGSAEVFRSEEPGVITCLTVSLVGVADARQRQHILENVWLTAHFDDDEPRDPSIRAPIGPLFLDFGQEPQAHTLMVGMSPVGSYYCRFAMPFGCRAVMQLHNRGIMPLSIRTGVTAVPLSHPDPDLFRFRATYHMETPFGPDHRDYNGLACRLLNLDGRDNYELLNVWGAGHFVGCGFHIDLRDAPTDRAAGEGDEMFFVDDDPEQTHYGTGTEDYVNDAWGIRGYAGPLSGDALAGAWSVDPQLYGYRLHLSDCIPFTRRGRFTLEHGTGNNCSGLYRSIAYWYMDPATARTRAEERRWEEIRTGLRQPTSPIT